MLEFIPFFVTFNLTDCKQKRGVSKVMRKVVVDSWKFSEIRKWTFFGMPVVHTQGN